MKKFVSLIITLSVILSLGSCGKSSAVIESEQMIDSIGEVDLNSYGKIHEAELYYESLTDEQKNQVENHVVLVKAIDTYNTLVKKSQVISGVSKEVYESGVAIIKEVTSISMDTKVSKYLDLGNKDVIKKLKEDGFTFELVLGEKTSSEEKTYKELVDKLCYNYIDELWTYEVMLKSGNSALVEIIADSISIMQDYKAIANQIINGDITDSSGMKQAIRQIEKLAE